MAENTQRLIISHCPIPFVVSLSSDIDETVDALVAIITDCSAYRTDEISFLELFESFMAFTHVIEGSKQGGIDASDIRQQIQTGQ